MQDNFGNQAKKAIIYFTEKHCEDWQMFTLLLLFFYIRKFIEEVDPTSERLHSYCLSEVRVLKLWVWRNCN